MSFSNSAKGRALRSLARTKEKAQRLEFTLRIQGMHSEALKVNARTRKLSRQIDQLIREAMRDWLGNARRVEAELKANNARLQRSIRNIRNSVQTASNVVKAIGFIDDAVAIVGKLLSPL
jgi:hypothetical protein